MASFVGRVNEIESIRTLLAEPDVRLLTLIGPGGVGKTRLAVQAMHGMTDVLHRAIYFVPLASVSAPAEVPIAIAGALDVRDGAARPLIEGIRAALRDRPTLIVLDNMEHVLPAAADFVSNLLSACPALNIVATSRSPLRIYGEKRFPVRPFTVSGPRLADSDSTTEAEEHDAVRLFLLRAQAVDPDLRLSSASRADVIEICRRLDGLPLAIELAAARAAELPPRAYLQRMVQSLPLPVGGFRDTPRRQQTMTAAVDWSYQLLTPEHQAMFRRLAVFAGEFDLDAAEAMAEGIATTEECGPVRSPLDLLVGLVEASLVQRLTDAAGESRYLMLETIRAFGLERVKAANETLALHERHARYYLNQVERANQELLTGRNLVYWLAYLDDRLSNIRLAMAWCEQSDPRMLALFTRALMQYWLRRSRMQEGIRWLLRAKEEESQLPEIDRGWVLANLGRLHQYTTGDGAVAYHQAALDIAHAYDDHELQLTVHIGQVLCAILNNQPDVALAAYDAAASIPDVQRIAPGVTQPTFLSAIEALVTGASGDLDRAGEMARQALVRAHLEGDDIAPGLLNRILISVERGRGNLEAARAHALTALDAYDAVGEAWNVGNCFVDLAPLFRRDHPELSLRLAGAADKLFVIHGVQRIDPNREPFRSLESDLRQRISDEAASAAWREGNAQPWWSTLAEARTTPVDWHEVPPPANDATVPHGIGGSLSSRECQVLRLIAEGQSDREIAVALGLSYRTITTHVTNILTKLDVPSRTAAVTRALRDGFLDS